jgi:hypothetical protein
MFDMLFLSTGTILRRAGVRTPSADPHPGIGIPDGLRVPIHRPGSWHADGRLGRDGVSRHPAGLSARER